MASWSGVGGGRAAWGMARDCLDAAWPDAAEGAVLQWASHLGGCRHVRCMRGTAGVRLAAS